MINSSVITTMLIVAIGCSLLIVLPFIVFRKDLKGVLKAYFVGALLYIIGDAMIRFPLLSALNLNEGLLKALIYGVVGAILGLFFRIFVLKGVLDKERVSMPFKTGMVMGMGQAAMEALRLGYSAFNNHQIANAINNGTIYDIVQDQVTPEQIDQAIEALQQITSTDLIASFIIQIGYIFIYGGIALMVIRVLKQSDWKLYLMPALVLFALSFSETILISTNQPFIIRALVIVVYAVVLGAYIFMEHKKGAQHV